MKKLLTTITILFLCIVSKYGQTIKLEGYTSGIQYCPSESTYLIFSARDGFNNKIAGKFRIRILVDDVEYTSQDLAIGVPYGVSQWYVHQYPWTTEFDTDSNKNLEVDIIHYTSMHWTEGFGLQSDDISIEVKFKPWYSAFYGSVQSFYVESYSVEPGLAVVDGEDEIFFCSSNEVRTVKLVSPPPRDPNSIENCGWNNDWVWELPSGCKITNTSGNLGTATNIYQGDEDVVKIQSPSGTLPSSAILNVRSEDSWLYPVNTESTIHLGPTPNITDIKYNTEDNFPISICYDPTNDTGTFTATPQASGAIYSYEWETNAGNLISNVSSPTAYVEFSGSGSGKYIKVRTYGPCGYLSWFTQNFVLQYDSQGCSGGGMFMMSVSPNPASEEITVDIIDQQGGINKKLSSEGYKFNISLFDENLDLVYSKSSKKIKNNIPLGKLKNGTYILRVTSPDGSISEKVLLNR